MMLLLSDLDIAARTLWGEARGEDYFGRRAVAHVLHNRLAKTTGQFARDDTLATTCLRNLQFSIWTPNDANFPKLFSVDYSEQALRECLQVMLEVLNGAEDITKGATHYHTHNSSPPWAIGHTPCLESKGHKFYNDVP